MKCKGGWLAGLEKNMAECGGLNCKEAREKKDFIVISNVEPKTDGGWLAWSLIRQKVEGKIIRQLGRKRIQNAEEEANGGSKG